MKGREGKGQGEGIKGERRMRKVRVRNLSAVQGWEGQGLS